MLLSKKGQQSGAIFIVLLVLFGAVALDYLEVIDVSQMLGKEAPEDKKEPVAFCDATAGITVKLDAKDPWGGTPGGSNYYKIMNGEESALSLVADAGTFSAPANSNLDLWMQLNAVDHYTLEVLGKEVKCTSPLTITKDVMPEGNYTTYLYDTENENQISNSTGSTTLPIHNQTLTANKIRKLRFRVEQENEKYTSPSVVVCYANETNIDEIKILDSSGNDMTKASQPDQYSGTTGYDEWAYSFPALGSNAEWNGFLLIDTDDTNNPGEGTLVEDNLDSMVVCKFYDTDCVEIDEAPYVACGVTEDPDDGSTDVGDSVMTMSFRYA